MLQDALKYNESGFMVKWIGQLTLTLGETHKGIEFLEKARILVPDDAQILYNLTRAYYNSRQIDRGDAILNQFKKLAANTTAAAELEELKESVRKEMKSR